MIRLAENGMDKNTHTHEMHTAFMSSGFGVYYFATEGPKGVILVHDCAGFYIKFNPI